MICVDRCPSSEMSFARYWGWGLPSRGCDDPPLNSCGTSTSAGSSACCVAGRSPVASVGCTLSNGATFSSARAGKNAVLLNSSMTQILEVLLMRLSFVTDERDAPSFFALVYFRPGRMAAS